MKATIAKQFTFDAAHRLDRLPPEHKCYRMHGHTYHVELIFVGDVDANGFLLDYAEIAEMWRPLHELLDHVVLNDVPGLEIPSTEHLAGWIFSELHVRMPEANRKLLNVVRVKESASTWCAVWAADLTADDIARFTAVATDPMRWRESWRADPAARRIADGHYTRQKVGADQFVPPGRCVVLVIPAIAYWVTSWPYPEYVKHAWPGAWVCSAFRNLRLCTVCRHPDPCPKHPGAPSRTDDPSSDLITDALAATRFYWEPPAQGMITFVDPSKVIHKRDPGRCFRKAGFHATGTAPGCSCDGTPPRTKEEEHLAFHIAPHAMPAARQPIDAQTLLPGVL